MVVEYYTKDVYGISKRYVNNPVQAKLISKLTGNKTISLEHMHALKQLAGIEFKHILQRIEMPM
jgi:hypothetical protein